MKKLALIVMIIAAFAVPASAVASTDGYTNVAGVQNDGSSGGPSGTSTPAGTAAVASTGSSSSSTLPFTGFELGLMLVAGVALLGTGFVLRRARTR